MQRVFIAPNVGPSVPLSSIRAADVEDLRREGWRIAGSLCTQAGQLRLRDRGNRVFCGFFSTHPQLNQSWEVQAGEQKQRALRAWLCVAWLVWGAAFFLAPWEGKGRTLSQTLVVLRGRGSPF